MSSPRGPQRQSGEVGAPGGLRPPGPLGGREEAVGINLALEALGERLPRLPCGLPWIVRSVEAIGGHTGPEDPLLRCQSVRLWGTPPVGGAPLGRQGVAVALCGFDGWLDRAKTGPALRSLNVDRRPRRARVLAAMFVCGGRGTQLFALGAGTSVAVVRTPGQSLFQARCLVSCPAVPMQ